MKKLIILIILLLTFFIGRTQPTKKENSEQINSIYKNAVVLLERNKLFEANTEFEKVIQLNPNHKDALYNLAIVNDRLGDSPSAIRFLLKGVKLNDKKHLNFWSISFTIHCLMQIQCKTLRFPHTINI
jgi:tetratricopeptide (TPR) repeat protein